MRWLAMAAVLACGCNALDELPARPEPELGAVLEIGAACTLDRSRCASWGGAPGVCTLIRTGPGSFVQRCALTCAESSTCPAAMDCQEGLCV